MYDVMGYGVMGYGGKAVSHNATAWSIGCLALTLLKERE